MFQQHFFNVSLDNVWHAEKGHTYYYFYYYYVGFDSACSCLNEDVPNALKWLLA